MPLCIWAAGLRGRFAYIVTWDTVLHAQWTHVHTRLAQMAYDVAGIMSRSHAESAVGHACTYSGLVEPRYNLHACEATGSIHVARNNLIIWVLYSQTSM